MSHKARLGSTRLMHEKQKLEEIYAQMARYEKSAQRDVQSVQLIGVSKTYGVEAIEPFIEAGLRHFGENKVQEAAQKWPALLEKNQDVTLHLIGGLQSNKAKDAVRLFHTIHSLDRPSLALELAREENKQGKVLQKFIQVNVGDEQQKGGVALDDLESFYTFCTQECGFEIAGLMCIPPVEHNPAPYFALLQKHAHALGVKELSMGMSSDFKSAIALGATYIRVGSALFGARA